MNGEYTLYQALNNYTGVTGLLSTVSGFPCLCVGVKEPDTWPVTGSTISIYAGAVDYRDKLLVVDLTVNCRAETESICKQIASAVTTSVNRELTSDGDGRFYVQWGQVILPQDENDSYNLPLTVTLKAGSKKD